MIIASPALLPLPPCKHINSVRKQREKIFHSPEDLKSMVTACLWLMRLQGVSPQWWQRWWQWQKRGGRRLQRLAWHEGRKRILNIPIMYSIAWQTKDRPRDKRSCDEWQFNGTVQRRCQPRADERVGPRYESTKEGLSGLREPGSLD